MDSSNMLFLLWFLQFLRYDIGVGSLTPHGDDGTDLALLTVSEVASLLSVSGEAVRAKVRSGELPAFRLGDSPNSRIRISSAAVANYLRATRGPIVERRY